MPTDTNWTTAQRLEGLAGEVRVNLLRLAALLAFYGHHLINVYIVRDNPDAAGAYHATVTLVVLAWAVAIGGIHWCLSHRWLPPALPYVVTIWDLALTTLILCAGTDPKTQLTVLYFLIIAAAPLRLSLPLIWVATFGAMAAYGVFLAHARWGLELDSDKRLARAHQIIFLLGLGAAGLLAGQMVRQVRRVAEGQPVVLDDEPQ